MLEVHVHIRKIGQIGPGGLVFTDITTVWTNVIGSDLGMLHVKFGWILLIGFGEEDFHPILLNGFREEDCWNIIYKTCKFPLHNDTSDQVWLRSGMWFQRYQAQQGRESPKDASFEIWLDSPVFETRRFFYIRHIRKIGHAPWRPCFLRYQHDLNKLDTGWPKDYCCQILYDSAKPF